MATKSGKNTNNSKFRIKEDAPRLTPLDIERDRLKSPDEGVSISLKYYRKDSECFSAWQSSELKKFSAALEKISGQTAKDLKSYKPLCVKHKGPPAAKRFSRPDSLSEDLDFYEIKIDASNKARVHGVFVDSIFFLVWLDRQHAVFP